MQFLEIAKELWATILHDITGTHPSDGYETASRRENSPPNKETTMTKKYISDFVKWQRSFDAKLKMRLWWDSSEGRTYVKAQHRKLLK